MNKAKVLIVTHVRQLWSGKSSGSVRAINSLGQFLARDHQVDYYCTKWVAKRPSADVNLYCGQGMPAYIAERLAYFARAFLTGSKPRRKLLLAEVDAAAQVERAAFGRHLDDYHYDVIIFEYLNNHHLVDVVDRRVTACVLDTHDLMHVRTRTYEEAGRDLPLAISEEQELSCFDAYNKVLAIQDGEYEYLRDKVADRAMLVKRPADLHPLPFEEAPGDKLRLCFLGSTAEHNVHALHWFVKEVWSEELREVCSLDVYGAVCRELDREQLRGVDGINLRYEVGSVDEAYQPTHLVINPVQIGSGLKIKNIEAIGYGRGVITTSLGAQGMEQCLGRSMVLADTAAELRELLLEYAADRDKPATLAQWAPRDAQEFFSAEACFSQLSNWIGCKETGLQ